MEQEALEQGLEGLLLSFDEQYPCWTPAMLALAGLDRSAADGLAREGLLEFEKGEVPEEWTKRIPEPSGVE